MNKSNICIVTIPGYTITELIYASKKTTVCRGQQQTTQISVIIKILNAEYPRLQDLIAFKNQFAISQQIDHPNIIKCYALEKYGNSYALILEDFSGISLSEYTNLQKLDINSFMPIAIAITKALEFLYAKKIIHKDIKPRNILINPQTQEIKLIDFGISSLLPKETADIKSPNVLSGTLTYMSPEQTGRMNRGIDYRTDFYSLGVTFYELLTGQLPFYSPNHLELIYYHLAKEPINAREINPQIPQVLADVITKLMAKNPDDRYQTARGIRYDLEICQKMLLTEGEINNFELAKRDISDRFLIHNRLYGREQEIITLLKAFENVSAGNKELMLVAGFSGIGKTAVVNEVHKPIVREKASEIQIDKLLYTLMQVISENVAANKSALILQKEGNLILVAQCMNEHECKFSTTPINDSQHLPLSIINYVANMQEYLLISDATNDQDFANDSYIIQHQSKSILCNPILNKGQLIGILYLENNLTVGAFTIDRLRILNLLSSQAAISLENAQLYSNLEEKVTQRTQELNENNLHLEQTLHELKATQSQLIQTEKMSSLGQMVAGIAHEINNPVNFIYVQIAIKDNGMGINPEIKQRIFDPFFTTKPVGEGTGLGLSISYQIIVDKHSGKLDCISAPGKGTEFIIEIPIKLHQQ